jgi:hypothetical protein
VEGNSNELSTALCISRIYPTEFLMLETREAVGKWGFVKKEKGFFLWVFK